MNQAVIVAAKRTAVGKLGGALKDVQPDDLAVTVVGRLLSDLNLEKDAVDEVIFGHAKQSSDQPNIARLIGLKAGLPVETPAYTVHRQCGSGLQAIVNAAQQIWLGESDCIIAGGVESMSTAPFYIRNIRYGVGSGNQLILDPNTESQPRSQPSETYGELTMGMTAENLAERYGISREEQDAFALESQLKALRAIAEGRFRDEIVPVTIPRRKQEPLIVDTDENPRQTSMEALAKLPPVFKPGGTVTAGNSSTRNDGASALVVMSESRARELGLKPLARIVSYGAAGVSPEIMGIGPVPATRKALERAGLKLDDIGLIELNEAFAAQSIAVIRELGLNTDMLNVNGGAIALGHPIGNSGARIMVTLIHEMLRRGTLYGMATLCIAGGLGMSVIIQNLQA
jgi:acetyl-CoA C-acetyltransferase